MHTIPNGSDHAESNENNGTIVHGDLRHRQSGWHAEKDKLEGDPKDSNHIDDWTKNFAHRPLRLVDFFTLRQKADEDSNGCQQGVSNFITSTYGKAYESASAWTPTEMNATNAELDPILIKPRSIWITVRSMRALTGTPKRLSTLAQSLDPGIASSLAKAQVHLEAATVILMEQKIVMTKTRKIRPRPPPGEPIT